ncbi:DUF3094 family protein [Marinibactrum halimedae]|uniref:DUF3094 family protein n=1 Tax=Marinibactrum halimedae TaxID=1444977 RepID=UPI001E2A26F5|nr:DUF3094 family protein [Marinibactrum halimedae]MCD9458135.1 DUF3094 domain-containing protein [Marinibactrum halimedae]
MPLLNSNDQRNVDKYVSSGINAVERKPFRPWLLLGVILLTMLLFSALAWWIGWFAGVV